MTYSVVDADASDVVEDDLDDDLIVEPRRLSDAWFPLRWHPDQDRAWRSRARFVGMACGRGSGKTEIARRRIVRWLPVKKPWPRPLYFYSLPTYKQARRVAWQDILNLVPRDWIRNVHQGEMRIDTIFGSQLYVLGLDNPARVEGVQWDGCVCDESCDTKAGTFVLSVMPALTHRNAWCWRIGVPKRTGVGAAEFKRWCGATPGGEGPVAEESYCWPSRDILTPEQLAYAKANYPPADFAEQFEASWEKVGGLVFYAFDEVASVTDQIELRRDKPLIIGSDFNVDPMAWVVMQRYSDGPLKSDALYVIDELFLRNTNTKATLDELHRRYGSHEAGFDFYGDATGRSRNTRASQSDYAQIKNDRRFRMARTWYPASNPSRHDRFAACNAIFKNAAGEQRCLVHRRCKNLIRDLTSRAFKKGTSEPDDEGDVSHASDAFGYPAHRLFPVRAMPRAVANPIYTVVTQ